MRVRVAALQLAPSFGDVEGNLARFDEAVRELDGEVDLVVTPELFNTGYDLDGIDETGPDLAEPLEGPTIALAGRLASFRSATIVVGLLEKGEDGLVYDTAAVVGPEGSVTPYRKTHLYPPERKRFGEGQRLMTVPTSAGRVGLMICFEHAFPQVATALALEGAQVIAAPSAVPNGYEHLLALRTRARAQDNQLFVVAANLAGGDFCGRSLVAGPRGEVLAEAGPEETTLTATLDLDAIEEERKREPALRMRRPELYR